MITKKVYCMLTCVLVLVVLVGLFLVRPFSLFKKSTDTKLETNVLPKKDDSVIDLWPKFVSKEDLLKIKNLDAEHKTDDCKNSLWEFKTFHGRFKVITSYGRCSVDPSSRHSFVGARQKMLKFPNDRWLWVNHVFGDIEKVIQTDDRLYFVCKDKVFELFSPLGNMAVVCKKEADILELKGLGKNLNSLSQLEGHTFITEEKDTDGKVIYTIFEDSNVQ